MEQTLDVLAAIDFAVGEREVDDGRVLLWGTSLGAGIAVEAMLLDRRVRAVVAQVGAYDLRGRAYGFAGIHAEATKRAQGNLPYPPPQPRVAGQLHGHMIREHYLLFRPIEDLGRRPDPAPMLIIDAANDELIDIAQHGQRLYERLTGPKQRVVLPGVRHYDIYRGEPLEQARKLAVDWYDARLK